MDRVPLLGANGVVSSYGLQTPRPPAAGPASFLDIKEEGNTLRGYCWDVLSVRASKYGRLSRFGPSLVFEAVIITLISTNIIMVVLDSVEHISCDKTFTEAYFAIEIVIAVVFTAEYGLRLWSCVEDEAFGSAGPIEGRVRWALQIMSLIDLSALIPILIDIAVTSNQARGLSVLRILRVLSLLRIERQSKSFQRLGKVLQSRLHELGIAIFVAVVLHVISASAMYYVENPVQPHVFSSILATMWWSVSTMTSVGYGDMVPETAAGKVFAALLAVLGVGLFALPAGILGSGFIELVITEKEEEFEERQLSRSRMGSFIASRADAQGLGQQQRQLPSGGDVALATGGSDVRIECPHCQGLVQLRLGLVPIAARVVEGPGE